MRVMCLKMQYGKNDAAVTRRTQRFRKKRMMGTIGRCPRYYLRGKSYNRKDSNVEKTNTVRYLSLIHI